MFKARFLLPVMMIGLASITSCGQNKNSDNVEDLTMEEAVDTGSKSKKPHSYGGWFCPDNFGGFPPMDIQDIGKIQVVTDRLPTQEETRNGTSLMYIDQSEYPDARPLEMALPRVARIHSRHSGLHELIIVIQIAVIGTDTIVGYRFPSGGNGSTWFSEVDFLSDEEVKGYGPAPMVYLHGDVQASREKIWKAITGTEYARSLGKKFKQEAFFSSDWTDKAEAHLTYEWDGEKATGYVGMVYGNLYLQIDYDRDGEHFTEKLMVGQNRETGASELHVVSGPYTQGIEAQSGVWETWFQEVKRKCEKK